MSNIITWTKDIQDDIKKAITEGKKPKELALIYRVTQNTMYNVITRYKLNPFKTYTTSIISTTSKSKITTKEVRKCFCGELALLGCNHCGEHLTQKLPVHQISLKYK